MSERAVPQQASFSDLEYASKKRRTRRELFLAEMDEVVPWVALLAEVEPHYPRSGGRGRPPVGLASMLRVYFLQQWFALSDRQMEDALYDMESMRRFAGFSNVTAALPDETTILNFRHLLERHDLTERLPAPGSPSSSGSVSSGCRRAPRRGCLWAWLCPGRATPSPGRVPRACTRRWHSRHRRTQPDRPHAANWVIRRCPPGWRRSRSRYGPHRYQHPPRCGSSCRNTTDCPSWSDASRGRACLPRSSSNSARG